MIEMLFFSHQLELSMTRITSAARLNHSFGILLRSFHTTMLLPDADVSSAQPLSGSSSSPRASSSDPRQPSAPSYISARSADVILSEVRPTRMKSEALRSVNILLDELLWLILGCARSFATDRLRTGLLKVLPSNLGKDALLEAEVELRAYVERNPPTEALPTDEATIQQFPLQQAFEVSFVISLVTSSIVIVMSAAADQM